jgi:exodeoxyribonuclease-3
MRIISFNVNSVRSMYTKQKDGSKTGTPESNCIKTLITEYDPDVLCFQEIKTQSEEDLICFASNFPNMYVNAATRKKGYAGTALLSKTEPDWVTFNFDAFEEDVLGEYEKYDFVREGRLITAKYSTMIVVTSYTVNSKEKLARLDERLIYEALLRKYMKLLESHYKLPVILCGDLNVAHKPIDLHNPTGKNKTAGYSPEEREAFQQMLDEGFTDSFRHLHPDTIKYTYWSNFFNSREKGLGWRIDYFLVSNSVADKITEADCLTDFKGSDHCPVLLDIDL